MQKVLFLSRDRPVEFDSGRVGIRLPSSRGPNSPWGASWGPREPPQTRTMGQPDAARKPNASASRSFPVEVATVRRGSDGGWQELRASARPHVGLSPPAWNRL